jgi:hypothetical protein
MKTCKNKTCNTVIADNVVFCPKCGSLNGNVDDAIPASANETTPAFTPIPPTSNGDPIQQTDVTHPPPFNLHQTNTKQKEDVEDQSNTPSANQEIYSAIYYWWLLVGWSIFYTISPLFFSNFSNYKALFEITGNESPTLLVAYFLMTLGMLTLYFAFPFYSTRYMAIGKLKPRWIMYGVLSLLPWYISGVNDFGKMSNWPEFNLFDWIGNYGVLPWIVIQFLVYKKLTQSIESK